MTRNNDERFSLPPNGESKMQTDPATPMSEMSPAEMTALTTASVGFLVLYLIILIIWK